MKTKIIPKPMKIFLTFLATFTVIFYTIGFIILASSGYKPYEYLKKCNFSDLNLYFTKSSINSSSSNTFKLDNSVTTLNIQFKHQDINISPYDGNELKVEVKNNKSLKENIYFTSVNNQATLTSAHSLSSNATINIFIPNKFLEKNALSISSLSGDIILDNISTQSINITTLSSDIKLTNLISNYISVSNTSGDIECKNLLSSNDSKFTTKSGDIKCDGNFGNLSANSTSGDIDLYVKDTLSPIALNSTSGTISLDIPSSSEYKISYYTVSGDLDSPSLSNGTNPVPITINTTSGDMEIDTHDI